MNNQAIFENIKQVNNSGWEYCSLRELFSVLEYPEWDKFINVLAKSKEACKNNGQLVDEHFQRVKKLIGMDQGAPSDIGDIHLSKYATCLIIENVDPKQKIVDCDFCSLA